MSRPKRELTRKFVVFCEGNTEYYYIDELRRLLPCAVNIRVEPDNLEGGGYHSFLEQIRTSADSNCIAKFILVDLDRYLKDPAERPAFQDLIAYCDSRNRSAAVPHFLIVQNPDFEYVACTHSPDYKNTDTTRFITSHWGYESLAKFKADKRVYDRLNSGNDSWQIAADTLRKRKCYIWHQYSIDKAKFAVVLHKMMVDADAESVKGSNFYELLDIIQW